jgi:tripartite-type tricarboxylate transporter receptor subunit TctC
MINTLRSSLRTAWVLLLLVLLTIPFINSCSKQTVSSTMEVPFYQGKVITIFVTSPAGGSTDMHARNYAKYLGRYIPGNPKIIIDNRGGGGGALCMHHYLENAKPNGLSLVLMSSGVTIRWLMQSPGHDYDMRKTTLLLGVPDSSVYYVNNKMGIHGINDLLTLGKTVTSGHTTIDSSTAIAHRFCAELLGYKLNQVFGYGDYVETKMAVIKGDVMMSVLGTLAWFEFVPSVEAGDILPLFQDGVGYELHRFPAVSDLPTVGEVYQTIYGRLPGSSSWYGLKALQAAQISGPLLVHAQAPAEAIEELEIGIKSMLNSAEFKEMAWMQVGTQDIDKAYLYGDRAIEAWNDVLNTPAETVALFK